MLSTIRTRLLLGTAATVAAASLGATPSAGDMHTGTMEVTTTVVQGCALSTAGSLDFGTYTPGEDKTGQAEIVVNCDSGSPAAIQFDAGQNPIGSDQRAMRLSGETSLIKYDLYSTESLTSSLTPGVEMTANVVAGDNTFTVWGKIPGDASGNDSVPAGDYADSVTVTLIF